MALLRKKMCRKYTQVITYRGHSNERIDISFEYAGICSGKKFPSEEDYKTILIIMANIILFITIILLWMFTGF